MLSTGKLVQAIPTTLTLNNGQKHLYQWGSGIVLNVIPDLLINAINTAQTPKASKTKSSTKMYLPPSNAAQGRWPAILAVLVSPYHPTIITRHALPVEVQTVLDMMI